MRCERAEEDVMDSLRAWRRQSRVPSAVSRKKRNQRDHCSIDSSDNDEDEAGSNASAAKDDSKEERSSKL